MSQAARPLCHDSCVDLGSRPCPWEPAQIGRSLRGPDCDVQIRPVQASGLWGARSVQSVDYCQRRRRTRPRSAKTCSLVK